MNEAVPVCMRATYPGNGLGAPSYLGRLRGLGPFCGFGKERRPRPLSTTMRLSAEHAHRSRIPARGDETERLGADAGDVGDREGVRIRAGNEETLAIRD